MMQPPSRPSHAGAAGQMARRDRYPPALVGDTAPQHRRTSPVLIKANFPARVIVRGGSSVDRCVILDTAGAKSLWAAADMLSCH